MPKLPVLSARDVVRGLEKLGFQQVGQRGSHIKLRRDSATVIVPNHREVRKGTLGSILQLASVSIDDLMAAISQ
jgi:predicted RNA binding protein YcfA (HicA-like mRNA interferase family)